MKINDFFNEHHKVGIAFSGGVDSAFLLYAAKCYAKQIMAYYVKSEFQPEFELEDAMRLSEELDVPMKILQLNVLGDADVASNPVNRCYYCKGHIFEAIKKQAIADGYTVLVEGTNASDDINDRPGYKVLQELEVFSPLRICGLTKDEIRRLSKEAGLFTWNKPAYACLATRIPTGDIITAEKLVATERAEEYLFSLGFSDFRVRRIGDAAKLQVREEQFAWLIEHRKSIVEELKKYYSNVYLDMEVRG